MLILTTTAAELYVHVDAPAEVWLLYEAHFAPDTGYRLATGEQLSNLPCMLRVFPWTAPHRSTVHGDIGWLCFAVSDSKAEARVATECLIEMSVGPECFDELALAARAGHVPSRIELTLMPLDHGPQESALWHINTTTELLIKTISFRIPLVPPGIGARLLTDGHQGNVGSPVPSRMPRSG